MELAIPFIALGGMYIISEKNKSKPKSRKKVSFDDSQKENFTNMGKTSNSLPNINIPVQNYPIMNEKDLLDTTNSYENPNTATDKYFNQNAYENNQNEGESMGNQIQDIYSLTGDFMKSGQFVHNNMKPFNGKNVRGQLYNNNIAESILDNYVGGGSQNIKKIEQAPLFKPEDNVQWAHGTPNNSDFYQSRVNPAMRNNMVKPFETEQVGPGLNKGYSNAGSGGFNSGMEARDKWLPKTVDELRITTNPKEEYSIENFQGPAQSLVTNIGQIGKVEKFRPDTFYIQNQDRWLTTTGQEKQGRMISQEIFKPSNRNETTTHYTGTPSANLKTASYNPGVSEESKRIQLPEKLVPHSSATGKGPSSDGEYFIKSHSNITNNRCTMQQPDSFRNSFNSAIGAVIAPIMDVLKPSRKEEYSCNIRVFGNGGGEVPSNYLLYQGDNISPTIKETTIYSPHGNVGNQLDGAYKVSEQQSIENQRDSTNCSNFGSAGGSSTSYGNRQYDAEYRQTNNVTKEKTIIARTNQGNTSLFNPNINSQSYKIDSDRNNNRLWVPSANNSIGPTLHTYGKVNVPQYNNQCNNCERMQPDILNAFKENPYTHSLTSSV
jgi:hypothetical protein